MSIDPEVLKARVAEIVQNSKARGAQVSEQPTPTITEAPKKARKSRVQVVAETDTIEQERRARMAEEYAPVVFGLLAPIINRWTPDKPYGQTEALMLSHAVVGVAEKYPDTFKYKEEFALLVIVAAQFGGRYMASGRNGNGNDGQGNSGATPEATAQGAAEPTPQESPSAQVH